jgi:hypothetical protein
VDVQPHEIVVGMPPLFPRCSAVINYFAQHEVVVKFVRPPVFLKAADLIFSSRRATYEVLFAPFDFVKQSDVERQRQGGGYVNDPLA